MRTHAFYSFLALIFLGTSLLAQDKNEKITWNENRPLSWEDFKAAPENSNSFSANTNSGVSYTWSYSTASGKPVLEYEVKSNFYPNLSWVKKVEHKAYLLAHEQLHFDISELHARKLRKAINDYEIGRTIRQDLRKIYSRIESERIDMQKRFDSETHHSEDLEAELKWRAYIAEELITTSGAEF